MRLSGLRSCLPSQLTASAVTVTALGALVAPGVLGTPALASPGTNMPSAQQTVLYREGFSGPDTPAGDWITKNTGGNYLPCLTAAFQPTTGGIPECLETSSGARNPDPPGSGAFEITPNFKGESGFGLYTRPLETDKGIQVDFDLFQYNAKLYKDSLGKRGGDGIAFFLINGAATPGAAGDAGGSLGYRNLPGGIVGLGFDEFGNFSDPRWGGAGGPGLRPNSVVLRGADSTGYKFITGVKSPYPLAVDDAVHRGPAKRHVTIELSTKNMLSVYINFFNGKGPLRVIGPIDLNKIDGEPPLPPTLKFGFAAATGAATAYHEVQGMTITGLPPNLMLSVSHSGAFKPGQTGSFKLAVANDPGAGPTTGPATVTFRVPDGMTPQTPSGKGWGCSLAGQTVTCTRSDTLNNGASYPPINVPVSVAAGASGTVTASGSVSDPDDATQAGKTATDSVDIGALSPDITITGTHSGNFTPGGTGQYVFTVSNKPTAGPTTGPTTVTFPVPAGMTPGTAGGTGWNCSTVGQVVTCTHGDVLAPGASYPPLTIGVSVAPGTDGVIPSAATAATGDDANPQSVTAPDTVTVTALPPDLAMALTTDGSFKAGGTGDYVMTVSNRPPGGPTNGPVTATFNVPTGLTVRSAAGDGWTCSLNGQTVACTRPGTGADAITGGSAYPPVRVTVSVPNTASGPAAATATVGTPGDTGKPYETAYAQTQLAALAPDVTVDVTAPPVTAGDPATITMIATDSPDAGPVTGPTTISASVPAGYPITSVTGDGWQCKVAGQKVTCTRPDPLAPGDSFPPVTITSQTPATASGQVPISATGQTTGQPSASTSTGTLPIKAAPPKLVVGLGDDGLFTAGQSDGSYQISVSDDPAAGPVTKPVTVTFPLPGGMTATSASGDGWACSISGPASGQKVTCKRSDPLAPGDSYTLITIATSVPQSLSGTVPATATADTTGPNGPITAHGSDSLTIGQLAPRVDVKVTPPHSLTAGGTGTYTIVASDEPAAGPTTGPTTVTFEAPADSTVTSADGDGWQCAVNDLTVTCTRPDLLQPGRSFPPVKVDIALPDVASGTATATGGVSTPGNGSASGAQATTQTPVTPLPPDLTVDVGAAAGSGSSSSATANNDNNVSVNVSDGSSSGPVTDPVTVTIPAPPGETPVSASGDGWNCGGMDNDNGFICVNVGGLDPGQSYAPINTTWDPNGDVTGTVPFDATGYTANQASTAGAEGTGTVREAPAAPRLNARVIPSGAVQAGGTEDMNVDVSDAATAGPATSGVTVTVPMPSQIRPTSAYGLGWTCGESPRDVTCHRPGWLGALRPGASYPSITVSGKATSPWSGGQIWATVGTD